MTLALHIRKTCLKLPIAITKPQARASFAFYSTDAFEQIIWLKRPGNSKPNGQRPTYYDALSSPLRNVKVASPCRADWDRMIGNERARFCGQCELNVYNLSSMSTLEAESLIARTEGRLCVRYYRRKDGSIITQDCPVGLRRLKARAARIKRAVASLVLGFLAGLGFHSAANRFGSFLLDPIAPWEHTATRLALWCRQPTTRHRSWTISRTDKSKPAKQAAAAELIASLFVAAKPVPISPSSDILRKLITHPAFLL